MAPSLFWMPDMEKFRTGTTVLRRAGLVTLMRVWRSIVGIVRPRKWCGVGVEGEWLMLLGSELFANRLRASWEVR